MSNIAFSSFTSDVPCRFNGDSELLTEDRRKFMNLPAFYSQNKDISEGGPTLRNSRHCEVSDGTMYVDTIGKLNW